MTTAMRDVVLVAALATAMFFTNLGGAKLWDRDEPRNAGCAAEMMVRGDWIVPVFNGELRAHKPVLLYWLMMSAYWVLGISEFSARIWSALLSVVTCLAVWDMGRRMFDRGSGLWAGLMLATCLLFGMAARAATPDAVLICTSALALWGFVRATFPEHCEGSTEAQRLRQGFPQGRLDSSLIYGCTGLAVLAKGPVGFVLPVAVMGLYLLITQRPAPAASHSQASQGRRILDDLRRTFGPRHFLTTCWSMRPLLAISIVLLIAGPWYTWVGLRTDGEFLRQFFLEHNVGRATQPLEGHSGPFLIYYLGALLMGFFPWSVFAGPALGNAFRRIRNGDPEARGCLLALCWVGVYVVAFSCAQTKLPSYITPCFPAVALLTGVFLKNWTSTNSDISNGWIRSSLIILVVVGITWIVAWPLATGRLFPSEAWLGWLGLPLVGGGGLGLVWLHRKHPNRSAASVAFGSAAFVLGLFAIVVPQVSRHQRNEELLQVIRNAKASQVQVASFGGLEPSWVFYGAQPIVELTLGDKHLEAKPAADSVWARRPPMNAKTFFGSGQDRFVITTDRHWRKLKTALPSDAAVLAECPLFLKRERLYLIGLAQPENVDALH